MSETLLRSPDPGMVDGGGSRTTLTMLAQLALLALLTLAAATAPHASAEACAREAFAIDGQTVEVQVCAPGPSRHNGEGRSGSVALNEIISGRDGSFARSVALDYLSGSDAVRAIDDAPLDRLGISKTLHLTIVYKPGTVRIEHALLVPGALTLK